MGKIAYNNPVGIKRWNKKAAHFMKVELNRKGITYGKLAELLVAKGFRENRNTIGCKMFNGSFSFAFFLRAMDAMKCEVNIYDV